MTRWGMVAALAFAAGLVACDASVGGASDTDGVQVAASFSVLGEVVERVGGDRVATTTIVPVGADPHDFEPRPSDAAAVEDADLVVDNGLGLNPWLEPLRGQAGGPVIEVGEVVGSAPPEDPTGRVDPHIWLDPTLLADAGDVVADALADVDPDGADAYAAGADELRGELERLDAEVAEILDAIPDGRRMLVTHEYAFSYFAQAYEFDIGGSVVGATTEEEPSAAQVRRLVDLVRDRDVPAVFPQTTEPADVIERVARDTDAALGEALYVDSVGEPGSDADDYAGMMRANARALVDGLAGAEATP